MRSSTEGFTFNERLKNTFIGKAKLIQDKGLFHKLTLVAFFAWIGLGADGISSSCYGPFGWQPYKLPFALAGVCFLILLNLRGVKESVLSLTPIFIVFITTHVIAILYGIL